MKYIEVKIGTKKWHKLKMEELNGIIAELKDDLENERLEAVERVFVLNLIEKLEAKQQDWDQNGATYQTRPRPWLQIR